MGDTMSDFCFCILLFPLFWLPIFLCMEVLDKKDFIVLLFSFVSSCLSYCIFEKAFVGVGVLCVCIVTGKIIIWILTTLNIFERIEKKTFIQAVTVTDSDDGTVAVFDGNGIVMVKCDKDFTNKKGEVVNLKLDNL